MSNRVFRAEVTEHATMVVNGLFSALAGPIGLRARIGSPSRELRLRRSLGESLPGNQPSFDNTGPDLLWAMVPGTKIVRSRVQVAAERRGSAATRQGTEYEILVTVQRALLGDWEANLYEDTEMLDDQVALLSRSGWKAVDSITDITEDPAIEGEPIRIGNVHRYDLRLFANMVAA